MSNGFSNLILKFSYIYIPLLAFSYKYIIGNQITKYFFDLIFFISLFYIFFKILINHKFKNNPVISKFIFFGFGFAILTFINNFYYLSFYNGESGFYIMPFIMAIKLPVYFIICSIVVVFSKPVELRRFVSYARFFSLFIIVDFIIRLFIYGSILRPSVLSETNYDSLMVLIGVCALFNIEKNNTFLSSYLIFGFALLLTQSKTSIVCFAVLSAFKFYNRQYLKYLFILLLFSLFSLPIVFLRLSEVSSIENLDRFMMWFSYFDLINESPLTNVFFGFTPGYYLRLEDNYLWFFIEHLSERAGALGLHSFNFHSMWLRIALDYGLFSLSILFIFFSWIYFKFKSLRFFIILTFLQGFTMGFFFLSVNVFVLFLYICSQLNASKFDDFKEGSCFEDKSKYS